MRTIIHAYRLDIRKEKDKKEYTAFTEKLSAMGLKLFDGISLNKDVEKFHQEIIAPLDGQEIELETEFLFNNQWNTAPTTTSEQGLRVFDWSEDILVNNRNIKLGMWLEQTEEMKEVRANTCKCGYCGTQYYKPKIEYCTACLGSEYLTEDQLHLLKLSSIKKDSHPKTAVPSTVITAYHKAQLIERGKRLEKIKADKLASMEEERKALEIEHAGFKWLIENNIDFENVIYYNHTGTFTFGWREELTKADEDKLTDILAKHNGFPYKYEIKTK